MMEHILDNYKMPKKEEFYNSDGSKRYAYVTFIIINDSYLPGALIFAYGIRLQRAVADLVCIVSHNISEEARAALRLLYDHVIEMDEIYIPHKRRHERQDRPFLFSRFNALKLGADGGFGRSYEKILIADADVLPLRNYDHLFTLDTVAGIINESKDNCMDYTSDGEFIVPDEFYVTSEWKWHSIYNSICSHGKPIPQEITDRVAQNSDNMGVNAALYLFEPSMDLYNEILEELHTEEISELISDFNWPEMQYITYKFSGKWHNIDLRFAGFNGYPDLSGLLGIHFAGLKPWNIKNQSINCFGRYDDFKLWYAVYLRMIEAFPQMRENHKLHKLEKQIQELTIQPHYSFYKQYLWNVKHFFVEDE